MDSEFDFKLRIYRDCKAPIWSYYLYETLSKARKSAMEYLTECPKVEIYAIGRGLNYGNDFVVETHFREELETDKSLAFKSDPDNWNTMYNFRREDDI